MQLEMRTRPCMTIQTHMIKTMYHKCFVYVLNWICLIGLAPGRYIKLHLICFTLSIELLA